MPMMLHVGNAQPDYNSLMKTFPQEIEKLFAATERNAKLHYEDYKKLSEM